MSRRSFRTITLSACSALLLFGTLTGAAEDRCDKRIRKAEEHLQQEVRKHGEHSRQAEKSRRDLEHARANCHR